MDLRSVHEVDTRSALAIQMDVIGALIMREIHTRFGRDNVGYLWLLIEPMMFAGTLTALHYAVSGRTSESSMSIASFTLVGYGPFLMFRQIVSRSESAMDANRTLLYHRSVTLLDILVARAMLEFAAVTSAVFILLALVTAIGIGSMPVQILSTFEAFGLLCWFSFSLGLLVAAGAEKSATFGRLVHPAMYFSMPLSGAFISMSALPNGAREILGWVPLTHIFELFRIGQFDNYTDRYSNPAYVLAWCLGLTLFGLFAIKITRRNMHID